MTANKATPEELVKRLHYWIKAVIKVKDKKIPLNGDGLIAVLKDAADLIESLQKQQNELSGKAE